jgi:hypothetical protein
MPCVPSARDSARGAARRHSPTQSCRRFRPESLPRILLQNGGCACANLCCGWAAAAAVGTGARKMRSSLIAASLARHWYVRSCRESPPVCPRTPQSSKYRNRRRPQTDLIGTLRLRQIIHRGDAPENRRQRGCAHRGSVASALGRPRPTRSHATQRSASGKPQVPGPVGLLLALALVDSGGGTPRAAHAE